MLVRVRPRFMPSNDSASWNPLSRLRKAFRSGPPKPKHEERRRDLRLPAHGPVTLVRQVDGADRSERVDLISMSDHGLSFRSVSQLAISETVRITDQSAASFEAIVRHCRPETDGYTVGVQVIGELPNDDASAPAAAEDAQPD